MGDELQLHIIELPKADRLGLTSGHLAAWVALFEHWNEESIMQTIHYPPVQQALSRLKTLSADAEIRQQAEVRARAIFEEAMAMSSAKAEGKAEGQVELLTSLFNQRFGLLPPSTPVPQAAQAGRCCKRFRQTATAHCSKK